MLDAAHSNESPRMNHDDASYDDLKRRMQARFTALLATGQQLFATDCADDLFPIYLAAFPEHARQYHNCSACRQFIRGFGHLVVINDDGSTTPAIWNADDASTAYRAPLAALQARVASARISGVFHSRDSVWGQPETGPWHHFSLQPPSRYIHRSRTQSARQRTAEQLEDFRTLSRALTELSQPQIDQMLALLRGNHLYRGERILGQAEWLDRTFKTWSTTGSARAKHNVLWRAVAAAPAGYCHPRSSMIGTLLEDIAGGMAVADVARRFAAKMDPLNYQRAQAPARTGQIEAAERAIEALGVAPAFARRYAVASDFAAPDAVLWEPSLASRSESSVAPKPAGVFDHLKAQPSAMPGMEVPPVLMTWARFEREVLPGAAQIHYRVPQVGRFCSLTAAADPTAAPILQWDSDSVRNSVSWAFPSPAARADQWGLTAGGLTPVRMIVRQPNQWRGAEAFANQGDGVFLLLDGARDTRNVPGGGLFTEHLRAELKPYRATIDAHLRSLLVSGADNPETIGFGIGLLAGGDWTERAAPQVTAANGRSPELAPAVVHALLVIDDSGSMSSYLSAARRAVADLVNSLRTMPGAVDVSITLFGSRSTTVESRTSLEQLRGVEQQMRARSGQTALNDTLISVIGKALRWPDARRSDTSFFLGVITDGEENCSHSSAADVHEVVSRALLAGNWTIAYAGAGFNARRYATQIGIPMGNIAEFEASSRGFEDIGARYSDSMGDLAATYAGGVRATTSFFGAASDRQAIGSDYPVLDVTHKSGSKVSYKLDRWN